MDASYYLLVVWQLDLQLKKRVQEWKRTRRRWIEPQRDWCSVGGICVTPFEKESKFSYLPCKHIKISEKNFFIENTYHNANKFENNNHCLLHCHDLQIYTWKDILHRERKVLPVWNFALMWSEILSNTLGTVNMFIVAEVINSTKKEKKFSIWKHFQFHHSSRNQERCNMLQEVSSLTTCFELMKD